jgi:intracellular septation protein A
MDKKKVLRILLFIAVFILAATVVVYFVYEPVNEWLAFYIVCCGGILVVNLIISVIFINKNFKDKGRA